MGRKSNLQKAIEARGLEIVYRPLADLHPNPKNPRKATKDAIERLAESINENPKFFEARPILLSDRTGPLVIIGGERRSEAARLLRMKIVPTILMHGLTEAQEDEIMIKDNTHAGIWEEEKLQVWGKEQLQGWNVDGVKWPKSEPQAKEDDFDPDKKVKSRVKRGDIWQLGDHRLMCGDSIDLEQVKTLMGGGLADISFFSPPYNTGGIGKNLTKDNDRSKYLNNDDNMSTDNYCDFITSAAINALAASSFVFMNLQLLANNKASLVKFQSNIVEKLADIIVWDKGRSQPAAAASVLNSEFEFVYVLSNKGNRAIGTIPFHGTLKNIVHIQPGRNEFAAIHNAVFPVALAAHFIEHFAIDSVLDLFGGTGTTLIAAEQLGRKCYMMELDPHYCDVIISRWEQFTGKKAVRIEA